MVDYFVSILLSYWWEAIKYGKTEGTWPSVVTHYDRQTVLNKDLSPYTRPQRYTENFEWFTFLKKDFFWFWLSVNQGGDEIMWA